MTSNGTYTHRALAKPSQEYKPLQDGEEETKGGWGSQSEELISPKREEATGGGWGSRTKEWVKRHGQTAAIGVGSLAAAATALESGGTVEEISMVGLGMTAAALAGGGLATAAPMVQAEMLHKEAAKQASTLHEEALELERVQHLQDVTNELREAQKEVSEDFETARSTAITTGHPQQPLPPPRQTRPTVT